MKTTIVHCKKSPFDIYIGRPSKWGNPFSHKEGTLAQFKVATREEAVEKYLDWIMIGEGKHLLNCLGEIRGKILACWCKPLSCHGDILVNLCHAKERLEQFKIDDSSECHMPGPPIEGRVI